MASSVTKVGRSCLVSGCSGSLVLKVDVHAGTGVGREIESSGSRTFFCLMHPTIFSKAPGVMCFSLPLDLFSQESSRISSGRTTCGGGDWKSSSCSWSDAAVETVSTLEARSGIFGMLDSFVMSHRGGREERDRVFV